MYLLHSSIAFLYTCLRKQLSPRHPRMLGRGKGKQRPMAYAGWIRHGNSQADLKVGSNMRSREQRPRCFCGLTSEAYTPSCKQKTSQ